MKILRSRVLWGALLVVMGILFLLESLNVLVLGAAWAILFALVGLAFAYTFLENREQWWAIIPAMTLLGIGALIAVDALLPELGDLLGGSIFLLALSLSFLIIYVVTGAEQWWAMIPGGILLSLALLIGVEPYIGDDVFAGLFLLAIGLTFAIVYLVSTPEGRMTWALIPAGILALIGLILLSAATQLIAYIWPVVLIVIGAYLLLRNVGK
ncbi:MAG: hypothetical protein ACP5JG_07565 [Anaerolineae bacterium]